MPNAVKESALFDRSQRDCKQIENIVVPLDGSVFAEHAIPVALGIAEQCGAVVQLVYVIVAFDVLDPLDALHYPEATLAVRWHKDFGKSA